jgi:hypothetical protein
MSRRASRVSGFIIQIAMILLGLALLTPIGLMVLPLLLLASGVGWILWRVLRRFPMHPIHITGRKPCRRSPRL